MVIDFLKIIFCNILSYGNQKVEFDFKSGLNLITGSNGTGKTTIMEALTFCLFGNPYRNIKIKDLINKRNKKNLYTECHFMVGSDEFKIIRTLKPDTISISKNGVEIDLLSAKKLTQNEIDKIIGVNYDLFKQIISLAVNYNKPFITLPIGDKRKIVEHLFNITKFGEMNELNKENIKNIKKQIEINNKTYDILKTTITNLKNRYVELENAKTNFDDLKTKKLTNLQTQINDKTTKLNNLKIEQTNLQTQINEITPNDITDIQLQQKNSSKELNNIEYDIDLKQDKINKLNKLSICTECNTVVTEEHKNKEIEKLQNDIINLQNKNEILKLQLNDIEKIITDINKLINDKKDLNNNLRLIKQNIENLNDDIENLKEMINNEENSKFTFDLTIMKKEILDEYNNFNNCKNEKNQLTKYYEIYQLTNEILSETGIKSYFFKQFIPILNKKIDEYLKLFEIPIILNFDEYMQEHIFNFTNLKDEVSYLAFSEGEKKRIDLAILLSFISITKLISNWDCNLLMIDELLDSAIDEYGLETLVQSLKNILQTKSNMSIYVISHRLKHEFSDLFTNKITIERKTQNDFSRII